MVIRVSHASADHASTIGCILLLLQFMRVSRRVTTLASFLAVVTGGGINGFAGPASFAVVDGDTVHLDRESYRLLGIDAAEIHRAQCDAERRLGELTKHRLETLLKAGAVASFPIHRQSA